MPIKIHRLNEDPFDSLPGSYADVFKRTLDTKNAIRHLDQEPSKLEEDTTMPDGASTVDPAGQDARANDDLSNHAVPVAYNENLSTMGTTPLIMLYFKLRKQRAFSSDSSERDSLTDRIVSIEVLLKSRGIEKKDAIMTNEAKQSKVQKKIEKNMHELKAGTLRSGSGKKVTDPKQALAISYSEAGETRKKNESTDILNFDEFVLEKYGPSQQKLEKQKNTQRANLAKNPKDRNAEQKKVTKTLTKIRKSVTKP